MFAAPRCAGLSDSESDDDDASWDWEDEAELPQPSSRCLFCLQTFLSTEKTWRHSQETHGFDITEAKQRLHLDSIGYIKMVNYIRQQEVYFSPSVLRNVVMLVVLGMYVYTDRNSGSPVVRGLPKLGWTTKDDDSSSLMDYHNIWEYFSDFVFVMLFCVNLGHMTTTHI